MRVAALGAQRGPQQARSARGRALQTTTCIAMPRLPERIKRVPAPTPSFFDSTGKRIQPLPVDFGFRSGTGRLYNEHYGEVPSSVWELAVNTMAGDLAQMRASYRFPARPRAHGAAASWVDKAVGLVARAMGGAASSVDEGLERVGLLGRLAPPKRMTPEEEAQFNQIREKLSLLRLDAADVAREEARRVAATGVELHSPAWVKQPFLALSWALDRIYADQPISKFWVLETVTRIPFFSYCSMLHLYESLGLWRAGAELRKIHFAEEWNEMHHLQIMESLGGDEAWSDRFLAEHLAVLCYWAVAALYLFSPKLAYNFAQRVEHHAADTYTVFIETNKELLATIAPPQVALLYYRSADLYLFDEFQAGSQATPRRPDCNTLLDVFVNIRDDECEHVRTLEAVQDDSIARNLMSKRM